MARKSITTSHAAVACDVCGRTLLRGENVGAFIAGGSRKMVCELCTARAANEGWIREGFDDALGVRSGAGNRGRSLLGRLRQRREGEEERTARRGRRAFETPAPGLVASEPAEGGRAHDEPAGAEAATMPAVEPAPEPSIAAREPAATTGARAITEAPRASRSVHAIPTNADLKMARALDLFNVSSHPKTVAGVARSLGPPVVAVRPSTSEGSVVGIVVGWELSWYRYEVDLADEAAGVRKTGQGTELSELSPDEQLANAAADDHGALVLAA